MKAFNGRRALSAFLELLYAEGDKTRPGVSYEQFLAEFKRSLILDPYQAGTDAQAGNGIHLHRMVTKERGATLLLGEGRLVFASRWPDRPLEAVFDDQMGRKRHGYLEISRSAVQLIDANLPKGGILSFPGPVVAAEFEHNASVAFVPEMLISFGASEFGARTFCARYDDKVARDGKIDGSWVKVELDAGYLSPSDAAIIQRVMEVLYVSAVPNNIGLGLIATHHDTAKILSALRIRMGAQPTIGLEMSATADGSHPFVRPIRDAIVAWFVEHAGELDFPTLIAATDVEEFAAYDAARRAFSENLNPQNWKDASEAVERYLIAASRVARELYERSADPSSPDPVEAELHLDGSHGLRLRAVHGQDDMVGVPADPTKSTSVVQVVVHHESLFVGRPIDGSGNTHVTLTPELTRVDPSSGSDHGGSGPRNSRVFYMPRRSWRPDLEAVPNAA